MDNMCNIVRYIFISRRNQRVTSQLINAYILEVPEVPEAPEPPEAPELPEVPEVLERLEKFIQIIPAQTGTVQFHTTSTKFKCRIAC